MKKIPTIFERDWNGDRSRVVDEVNPDAQWVFDGEGIVTRKLDGTSCMFNGQWWKRREVKKGMPEPKGFLLSENDLTTGKRVGWMPVNEGPEDRYHREAIKRCGDVLNHGTYELIGPKIQGNKHGVESHGMISHLSTGSVEGVERTSEGIRAALEACDVEGFVFQHEDGRMAKIKRRDFGLDW